MKPTEITVLSGKGGTGKTTFTSLLATKLAEQAVLCDADVDAPDLWILLHPKKGLEEPFFGGDQAVFDLDKCVGCGRCEEVCRFRALEMKDGKPLFEEGLCEGCSACVMVCPADCITLRKAQQGDVFFGPADTGPIWHAKLKPGGENSGMLVQQLRNRARETAKEASLKFIVTDGPPGVACPAISALTGSDLAIAVTEPTKSARHDLERLGEMARRLSVPLAVVINKSGLSQEEEGNLYTLCREKNWPVLTEIPFDKRVVRSIAASEVPMKLLEDKVNEAWAKIETLLHKNIEA